MRERLTPPLGASSKCLTIDTNRPPAFTRCRRDTPSPSGPPAPSPPKPSDRRGRFQVHRRASRTTKSLRFQVLGGLEWSCEASLSRRRNRPQYHHAKLHTIASNFLIVVVVVVDLGLLNDPQFGLNSTGRPPVRWLPKRASCQSATSAKRSRR